MSARLPGRHRWIESVAVGGQAPATVGASDPGPLVTARGHHTARGRAGAATIPTPRPGGRPPRPARPGPRHRLHPDPPVVWGAAVALLACVAAVGLLALLALVPVWP